MSKKKKSSVVLTCSLATKEKIKKLKSEIVLKQTEGMYYNHDLNGSNDRRDFRKEISLHQYNTHQYTNYSHTKNEKEKKKVRWKQQTCGIYSTQFVATRMKKSEVELTPLM